MGKRRQISLRTQHYLAVSELVSRTDLSLTVPQIFADFLASQLPVRYLQLPFSVPNLETHLYWHESTDQDQANRWLREVILELHEKLPWK
jgi:DNA-binding transcriptional LysR family regulator